MSTSKYHSHIVCLEQKNSNHSTVNAYINNELLSLQTVHHFYVHQMQATVPIVIYPLAILADRPERCALNATLNYTGNSTRRWLYSSLTDPQ